MLHEIAMHARMVAVMPRLVTDGRLKLLPDRAPKGKKDSGIEAAIARCVRV